MCENYSPVARPCHKMNYGVDLQGTSKHSNLREVITKRKHLLPADENVDSGLPRIYVMHSMATASLECLEK
jgi:hypothetical protein